ncbi:uncharacterized protein LOC110254884 [Exaiptasia diaphana]|uniref:Uncharacterized protein n=1 Tax=Exaiptasia diaphana TaxID=2652724 RepID=A0A913YZ80_EXADI|nr:uncharacterized protein LOC110254884 [Exaiptasia diaphana]
MIARCLDKKYRRTIFLVVLAVVGIALFDILYSYNQDILPIQKRVTPILPLCRNVLQVMREGSWFKKPYITTDDVKRRYDMNIILRKHRGQPTYLNRSDFRCGINYLIHAPDFGPKIPALCMRNSDRHCCNADGLCSNGQGNCSCAECTDFRNIVEAELYDWLPLRCKIMNYSTTTHAQGFLKPPSFRKMGQNNDKISQYNRVMRDKLKQKGVEVFDVFPMTKGVHSYDGTHYGYGMNMIKAQYLLNYIHQTIQAK